MPRRALSRPLLAVAALVSAAAAPLEGQAPTVVRPDPGIESVRVVEREEVRVSRISVEPGAVRRVHEHDDVRFQLFLVVSGVVRLHLPEETVELTAGEVRFIERGVPHGFENAGADPAVVTEIFVWSQGGS